MGGHVGLKEEVRHDEPHGEDQLGQVKHEEMELGEHREVEHLLDDLPEAVVPALEWCIAVVNNIDLERVKMIKFYTLNFLDCTIIGLTIDTAFRIM